MITRGLGATQPWRTLLQGATTDGHRKRSSSRLLPPLLELPKVYTERAGAQKGSTIPGSSHTHSQTCHLHPM